MSHSYRTVHIPTFLSFRHFDFFTSFLSSFHFIYLYFHLHIFSITLRAAILSIFVRNIICFLQFEYTKNFTNIKTALNKVSYIIFLVFHYRVKHFPFLLTTVPCSFILCTLDNRSFDKANFRLTLQRRRTFKFLPSPRTEEFKFPTSSAPTSI